MKIQITIAAILLTLLFPYLKSYFECPAPQRWQEAAVLYKQRMGINDNVFIAPPWMSKRAMDWSRFGMISPITENDLYQPPGDRDFRVWLMDYGEYFAIHWPRIQKKYRLVETHVFGDNLRAYVLALK